MAASDPQLAIHIVRKRYTSLVLMAAVALGGGLILFGYIPWGKGLIVGALFSILNFKLMAVALPYHLGHKRRTSVFFIPLISVCGRFAIMAAPLIFAAKYPQIAISTVAIGLFMIPLAILSEHLFMRWRHFKQVGF